jgi:hypothetical protein
MLKANTRPSTFDSLEAALDRHRRRRHGAEALTLCQAYCVRSDGAACEPRRLGSGADAVAGFHQREHQRSGLAAGLAAAPLRDLSDGRGPDLGKANIGRAIGVSRQAVHKSVAAIEAERDRDADFDELMGGMMLQVKGQRI